DAPLMDGDRRHVERARAGQTPPRRAVQVVQPVDPLFPGLRHRVDRDAGAPVEAPVTVIADDHQVARHVERDAMRIGQPGGVAFENAQRRLVIGRLLLTRGGSWTVRYSSWRCSSAAMPHVRWGVISILSGFALPLASRENTGSQFCVSLLVT